ncbi:MAG: membrane integrity-associated transporter subunit PqiC [Alphaproteobacteria bacterium]|nr:membrane integrity-associated transporter subunit PqiC [Alphaproteobacteria bacterium]
MSGSPSWLARSLAIGMAALLAGCGGIFSDTPRRPLYQLKPAVAFAAPLRPVSAQLLIALPNAPAGLDTARVALSRAPMSLDYFADAEWADGTPVLVQSALLEAFEKSGAVPAVGRENAGLRADFILETDLRDFTAVYDSPNAPPRVTVAFTLKLIKIPERKIVAQRVVARQQPAAGTTIPAIVEAFNTALAGAVEETVRWVATVPALSGARASLF